MRENARGGEGSVAEARGPQRSQRWALHHFPEGPRSPSAVTHIFILSTVTSQHLREGPQAGGQGQTEVLLHPPAQGRLLPNLSSLCLQGEHRETGAMGLIKYHKQ